VKLKLSEFQQQAQAGREAVHIQKASFLERRLFYLMGKLCYKGTR